ncbi:hypothetical protein C0992_012931, partial [Termitomyces sp. T32_za158]
MDYRFFPYQPLPNDFYATELAAPMSTVLPPTTTDSYITYETMNAAVTTAVSAFEAQVQAMITALVPTAMPVLAPTTTDCYVTYEDVKMAVTAAFSTFELQVQDRITATVAKANQEGTPMDSYYYDTGSGQPQSYIEEIPYLEQAKKEAVSTWEERIAQIEQPPEVFSYFSASIIDFPTFTDAVTAMDNTATAPDSLANESASGCANLSALSNNDSNLSKFSLPTDVSAFLSFTAPTALTDTASSASGKLSAAPDSLSKEGASGGANLSALSDVGSK